MAPRIAAQRSGEGHRREPSVAWFYCAPLAWFCSAVDSDRRTLVDEARKKRVITALVALAQADPEFKILAFIDYLQDRGAFTPKQLALLLWRFEKLRVPFDVRDFKLTIRRDREKVQLLEMADWQIERLLPAMSPSQRQFLAEARSSFA